jgi:prepilin peptidase CpaA
MRGEVQLSFATDSLIAAGCLTLMFAALHDVAARTVPNWSSLALLGIGFVLRMIEGNWAASLSVGAVVFIVSVVCWLRGWLGGGDVKLLTAASVVVPPLMSVNLLLAVSLAGGALAVVYLLLSLVVNVPRRDRPQGKMRRILRAERYRISRKGPLPYASAIAAGAIFVLLNG